MKVTGNVGKSLQDVQKNSTDKLKNDFQSAKTKSQVSTEGSAQINLSSRAQQMKQVADIAKSSSDVNADKVKKFQDLIDSGQYKVDAGAVADRMVDDHLMTSFRDE